LPPKNFLGDAATSSAPTALKLGHLLTRG